MNDDKLLEDNVERSNGFFTWVQTFTKKIVTITFFLFVIFQLFELLMILLQYTRGDLMYLDTFITETNETFRVVIGGYIIKAACENTVKIICSLIQSRLHIRYCDNDEVDDSDAIDLDYTDYSTEEVEP